MNQEQQLQAIRERWSPHVIAGQWAKDDVATLLRLIDERDAIIHDLMIDGAARDRLIRECERGAILAEIKHFVRRKNRQKRRIDAFDVETQIIGTRGVVRECPLPPDQARQECERLREKLRAIKEQAEDYLDTVKTHSSRSLDVVTALGWLRAMANDDEVAK